MDLPGYKRHVCNCCKKKLYEKDMEPALRYGSEMVTRYGKKIWICFKCKGKGKVASDY